MKLHQSRLRLSLLAVGAASALLLAGCAGADAPAATDGASSSDPIVIGAAIAQSGFIEAYDTPVMQSFEAKIDEINAEGGIAGRQVEIKISDTESDITRGGQAAQELIEGGADIILTSADFDYGSPAAIAAQNAGIASFTLAAASPKFGVQGIGDLAFSFQPSVGNQAAVLASFAIEKGWTNAYTFLDDTLSYTRGMDTAFTKFYEEAGGTIVGSDSFKNDDSSIATQISRLQATKPDVILMNSYPPGGASAIRQIRAAGIDTPIISGEAFDGTYWIDAVPGLSNFYISTDSAITGDQPDDEVTAWIDAFTTKYGEGPSKGQSVIGWALAQGLQKAITATDGDTSGAKIAEALESFDQEPLIIGPTTFTADAHIPLSNPLVIMEYVDGVPKYLETIAPTVDVAITDGVG